MTTDPVTGERRLSRKSLGHRDQKAAKLWADREAARIRDTGHRTGQVDLTIGELLAMYLAKETPFKGDSKQSHDRRAAALFEEHFGSSRRVRTLGPGDWDEFIRARRSGRLCMPHRI